MPSLVTYGVQSFPASQHQEIEVGKIVSGIDPENVPVLALTGSDEDGAHFIVLTEAGPVFRDEGWITWLHEIDAELVVEALDSSVPYALPLADPQTNGALVIDQLGQLGMLVVIQAGHGRSPWLYRHALASGLKMGGRIRATLRGYRLVLKVDGREDPFEIFRLE